MVLLFGQRERKDYNVSGVILDGRVGLIEMKLEGGLKEISYRTNVRRAVEAAVTAAMHKHEKIPRLRRLRATKQPKSWGIRKKIY